MAGSARHAPPIASIVYNAILFIEYTSLIGKLVFLSFWNSILCRYRHRIHGSRKQNQPKGGSRPAERVGSKYMGNLLCVPAGLPVPYA